MLGQTLDSISIQREFSDFEVLVIDDRSSDGTREVVRERALRDPRIKLLLNERRQGAAGARNFGLTHARGEWIAFLDGDDLWEPGNLASKMSAAAIHPDVQLISSDYYNENAANRTLERHEWSDYRQSLRAPWRSLVQPDDGTGEPRLIEAPVRAFIEHEPIGHSGTFTARRGLIERAGGFNEELEVGEDIYLWIQLARIAGRMVYVPTPLMYYRYRPGSLTNQDYPAAAFFATRFFGWLRQAPEYRPYRASIDRRLGQSYLRQAYHFRKQGRHRDAIAAALAATRYDLSQGEHWRCLAAALTLR
ncbi:MAG: glycosyltransferase family 2 protein [Burkholderiales bacterium]|nr:glycosyltransferase family 2 protein [Burkholderiales bacterium]MDE1925769.1 glycosyltransferase [Burkholderiales bacterium]